MRQFLLRISFRVMVLLSAFFIAIGISAIVKHRRSLNNPQPCLEVPTADSLTPPCKHADYSLLPTLTYCDLIASPETYENRLVRLRLGYLYHRTGMLRQDEYCTKVVPNFDLEVVAGSDDSATVGLMNAWNEELLPRNNVFLVVGRFKKSQNPNKVGPNKFQLELLKIESVLPR